MRTDLTIKLVDWLRTKKEWIVSHRPTSSEVAGKALKDLGFAVKTNSVIRLCKPLALSVTAVHRQGKINQRTKALAEIVADLFDRLGEPRPANLVSLLDSYTQNGEANHE